MSRMNAQFVLTDPDTGTIRGNAAKMFNAEVLLNFRRTTLFRDMKNEFINIKSIVGRGDSMNFPLLGSDPDYETTIPGDLLLGQSQSFGRISITIDDLIVGHRMIASDDQMISHFDVIAPYAASIGRQIANSEDDRIIWSLIRAARTAAKPGFHNGGTVVTVNGTGATNTIADAFPQSTTGASVLRNALRTLGLVWDQNEVPQMGRKAVLSAYGRSVMLYDAQIVSQVGSIFNADFQGPNGPNQMLDRKVGKVEGFDIYVSNTSIPNNVLISNRGPRANPSKYDVDCRYVNASNNTGQPIASCFAGAPDLQAPLGMVVAENLFTDIKYISERSGTFMKGENFIGVDPLCVWCAGEIRGAKTLY